jgi:hypothetical protein
MTKELFTRQELLDLYYGWQSTITRDKNEFETRHLDDKGNVIDVDDPSVNRFAGKIAGQTELLIDFANLLEAEPIPNTIEGIDKP